MLTTGAVTSVTLCGCSPVMAVTSVVHLDNDCCLVHNPVAYDVKLLPSALTVINTASN